MGPNCLKVRNPQILRLLRRHIMKKIASQRGPKGPNRIAILSCRSWNSDHVLANSSGTRLVASLGPMLDQEVLGGSGNLAAGFVFGTLRFRMQISQLIPKILVPPSLPSIDPLACGKFKNVWKYGDPNICMFTYFHENESNRRRARERKMRRELLDLAGHIHSVLL